MAENLRMPSIYHQGLLEIEAHQYDQGREYLGKAKVELLDSLHTHQHEEDASFLIFSQLRHTEGAVVFSTAQEAMWELREPAQRDDLEVVQTAVELLTGVKESLHRQVLPAAYIPDTLGSQVHAEVVASNGAMYGYMGRVLTGQMSLDPKRAAYYTAEGSSAYTLAEFLCKDAHDLPAFACNAIYTARHGILAGSLSPSTAQRRLLGPAGAIRKDLQGSRPEEAKRILAVRRAAMPDEDLLESVFTHL